MGGKKDEGYGARAVAGMPAAPGAPANRAVADASAPSPSVLLVGGSPEASASALIARLADDADYVVAVDRGLDRLMAACAEPDLFCGDCDTASPEAVAYLQQLVAGGRAALETYDPHKDYTDLTLALQAVERRWPRARLTLTCFGGGRPDHLLAVLGTLMRCGFAVALAEDGYRGRVLRAGERWDIEGCRGASFSFVPLAPGTVVSEQGMEWELDHHPCGLLGDLGVSNVLTADVARMSVHAGCAVAYVFRAQGRGA